MEYNKWRSLQKYSSRRSAPQLEKEKIYLDELNDLFDIAHANALGPLTLAEDQSFLLAQREKGRRGYMGGVDRECEKQEARKHFKKETQERLRRKDQGDREKLSAMVEKQEQAGIKRYAAFCVKIYVRSWFEATDAAAAPANDLALLKRLALYEDKGIADAAVTAFSRHLWYLKRGPWSRRWIRKVQKILQNEYRSTHPHCHSAEQR
jgi:hypothetical protein